MYRLLVMAIVAGSAALAEAQMPLRPTAPLTAARFSAARPGNSRGVFTRGVFAFHGRCCGPFGGHLRSRAFFGAASLGFIPWFYDDYEPQPAYVPVPVYEPAPSPPPPAVSAAPAEAAEPLIIERQGDAFIRYGGTTTSSAVANRPAGSRPLSQYRSSAVETPRAPAPPPVTLVFRDQHQLEVGGYAIVGPVLYADSQAAPIRIADLDLSGTIKLNQQRGVEFRLPSSPGEIMLRF